MIYQRVNAQTGAPIGAPGFLPPELVGLADESLADLSWSDPALGFAGVGFLPTPEPAPPAPPHEPRRISKVDFWRRFTPAEQVAMLGARKTIAAMSPEEFGSPSSVGWWQLAVAFQTLDLIPSVIELDHPDTVAGVEGFAAAGLVAPARVPVILQ